MAASPSGIFHRVSGGSRFGFSQETGVVLEEFRKVYPLDQA